MRVNTRREGNDRGSIKKMGLDLVVPHKSTSEQASLYMGRPEES